MQYLRGEGTAPVSSTCVAAAASSTCVGEAQHRRLKKWGRWRDAGVGKLLGKKFPKEKAGKLSGKTQKIVCQTKYFAIIFSG